MAASSDLDEVFEQNHLAVDEFAKGNHRPLEKLYSKRDDVTLGNPFGPFVRGFEQVVQTMQRAASFYRDGEAIGFELVVKHVTPDLAYIVEVKQIKSKIGGRDGVTPVSLRVTSIFRREDGAWRLVHRHADDDHDSVSRIRDPGVKYVVTPGRVLRPALRDPPSGTRAGPR